MRAAVLQVRLPWPTDLQVHVVNAIYVIGSVAISRRPFLFVLLWVPLVELIVYLAFAYFFHLAGGKNTLGQAYIYPFLDFYDPVKLFASGILLVTVTVLCHGIVCFVDRMAKKVCEARCHDESANRSP